MWSLSSYTLETANTEFLLKNLHPDICEKNTPFGVLVKEDEIPSGDTKVATDSQVSFTATQREKLDVLMDLCGDDDADSNTRQDDLQNCDGFLRDHTEQKVLLNLIY